MVDEEQIQEQTEGQTTVEQQTETDASAEEEVKKPKNIVTIDEAGPCKKKVSIEIPEEAIKMATDEQYENLRKEALVPGFRKGRAPRRLLEKRFGKEVTEQVKLKLLADAGESAIKAVQRLLVFLGYSTASSGAFLIDGDFGHGTNRGVAQVQFEKALTPLLAQGGRSSCRYSSVTAIKMQDSLTDWRSV